MAKLAFRHAILNAADRIVHVTGGDVMHHRLRNRQLQSGISDTRHDAHDVALRQYADDAPAAVEHRQCIDAMRGEQLRRRPQVGCRFDGDDVTAPRSKNSFQAHARRLALHFVVSVGLVLVLDAERLNAVPSAKVMQIAASAPTYADREIATLRIISSRPITGESLISVSNQASPPICSATSKYTQ